MKKIATTIICLLACLVGAQEIRFEAGTWKEILAKADKEDKLIFLRLARNSCPGCEKQESKLYRDKTVADYFNAHFINVKMSLYQGEGAVLAKRYGAFCCPTQLFINKQGDRVHMDVYREANPQGFVAIGKAARTPSLTFSHLEKQFTDNASSYDAAARFIKETRGLCMSPNGTAVKYLDAIPADSLLQARNWRILESCVDDIHSKPFRYLLDHRNRFAASFGEKKVNDKICNAYLSLVHKEMKSVKSGKEAGYHALRNEMKTLDFPRADELRKEAEQIYQRALQKSEEYYRTGIKLANSDKYKDHKYLAGLADWICTNCSDKTKLAEGEKLAARACALKKYSWYMYVHSRLLEKNGKTREAQALRDKAIAVAKTDGGLPEGYLDGETFD